MRTLTVAGGMLCLLLVTAVGTDAQSGDPVQRGRYLVTIMACGDCHTGGALMGKPDPNRHLGGSEVGFEMPGVGVFYPPNLTPDPEAGLGRWTDDQMIQAFRRGVRPDGRQLAPIMPWPSLSILTDEDARAVVAYLRSLPAVRFTAPKNSRAGEKPPAPYMTIVAP